MSISSVNVFIPFDVVFAEVAARLDFDQIKRNLAGVYQAVNTEWRQIDGFIFMQNERLVVFAYFSDAVDDDPVFGTMMVPLQ